MKNKLQPELDFHMKKTWAKFLRIYPELRNFAMPVATFNNRLKSCAGRCFYTENRVDFSTSLYVEFKQEMIETTIPHEIAHQIDFNLFGYSKAMHGRDWKDIMIAYGLKPDIYHNFLTLRQERLMLLDCK